MSEFQPNKEVGKLDTLLRDVIDAYLRDQRMSWAEVIGIIEVLKYDLLDMMTYGEDEEIEEDDD